MKKITKIIIAIAILFLLTTAVSATDIDKLKVPFGYSDLKDGVSMLNDGHTKLYIGKMSDNEGVFDSNIEEEYVVTDIGNNTYLFTDDLLKMYGFQEKVNIDGTDYLVCIYKDSALSPADQTLLKEDLDKFNKDNNLKPIAV
ncbi:hypothetical protein [Methanobrevibacter sp.]|uniref:hypothetical protein n=1 Tax=Methanobrevibacter sp. TaxID=66852 RepID=UPI00386F11A6